MKVLMNSVKKQKGFTLAELGIAGAILVLLTAVGVPMYAGYQDRAEADGMVMVATNLTSYFRTAQSETRTSRSTATNDMPFAGNGILDVLILGPEIPDVVSVTHLDKFQVSGLSSLRRSFTIETEPTQGNPGAYSFNEYPVTFDCDGTYCFSRYADVSEEVAEMIWLELAPNTAFDNSSDQDAGVVAHGTINATGTLTVDIRMTM